MDISLIAAVSQNGVIGDGSKIPWHISEDFKHFKEITMGHSILMGKNTFESIGKVLPGRTNIILSSDKNFKVPDGHVFGDVDEALKFAESLGEKELMIIGGGSIYKLLLPKATKIYLTRILKEFKGNVFFPEIDINDWKEEKVEKHFDSEIPYEFVELIRK